MNDTYFYSFFDLWPYFILGLVLFFCLLSGILTEKQKSNTAYSAFLVFIVLRYNVGWDYFMYHYGIVSGETKRYEFLSKLIMDFGHFIKFYPIVFAIFGFLILYIQKKAIEKYSTNVALSWIVYFSIPFLFAASISTIRQAVATSIIIYSFDFVYKRQPIKFLISVFIAYLFHSSGIAGLLIYPLVFFKINKKWLLYFFIFSFLIAASTRSFLLPYVQDNIFDQRITYYVTNSESQVQSTSMQYLFYIISAFNLIFYNRLVRINPLNAKFIAISIFGVSLYNILSFEPNSAYRLGGIFMSFWLFVVPSYSGIFTKTNFKGYDFVFSIFLILILAILINSNINAFQEGELEKISFIPYDFWFFHLNF